MKFLAMCIEACAIWGANCASVCLHISLNYRNV